MVELLEQTNGCANKIEFLSVMPALLFYQLRSGLVPVWIYGHLVGSRLPTFISDNWEKSCMMPLLLIKIVIMEVNVMVELYFSL